MIVSRISIATLDGHTESFPRLHLQHMAIGELHLREGVAVLVRFCALALFLKRRSVQRLLRLSSTLGMLLLLFASVMRTNF